MANNYTQFSESYSVTLEQIEFVKKFLATCTRVSELIDEVENIEEEEEAKYLMSVFDCDSIGLDYYLCNDVNIEFEIPKLNIVTDKPSMWVYSEESGIPDFVACMLKAMLKETNDNSVLSLTWASVCSKPRLSEFGGGWFAVSREEILYGSSWDASAKASKKLSNKLKKEGKKK